jgi:molybdenum cofactor cytidylyltransferase
MAFVGAGGKTTGMFQLARELEPPVLVTTTTHLGQWQISSADRHVIAGSGQELEEALQEVDGVVLVTGPTIGGRVGPPDRAALDWLNLFCQDWNIPLLIEADGAHEKPLKAPAAHEPNIPEFVRQVVLVAGLSGLGKPLTGEVVHRPAIFSSLSGIEPGALIPEEGLVRILTHPQGGKKNIPPAARRVALLNQVDTIVLQAKASRISRALLPDFHAVVTASLLPRQHRHTQGRSPVIHAVHEPVGAVLLAAGAATRFGKPKQLLDWRGEPFVHRITRTALQARLNSVVVVTGAYAPEVRAAIADLPVKVVHNPDWQEGQASSIRTGLAALCSEPGAWPGSAFFLLADQPQLPAEILHAMTEEHTRQLASVIAPLVDGQRANPVLFDQRTFPALFSLQGDVGGRAIFSIFSPSYLPWHDRSLLFDVDSPEDYQRLQEY